MIIIIIIGIEEIPLLEDLDISENCLADHRNLWPLFNLNKLRRVSKILLNFIQNASLHM